MGVRISIRTPTLTLTATPDPCTHGFLDGEVWVVGLCDNFWYISWRTGYLFNDLIVANPIISQQDFILPGQIIQLPRTTPGPTATLVIPPAFPQPLELKVQVYLPLIMHAE